MIGQYLSNTNEKATVSILQNILELNKATYDIFLRSQFDPLLLTWRSLPCMGQLTTAGALISDPNKQLRVTQ
jgi:hypothetical protein